MILTPEIHRQVIAAIGRNRHRPVVLPDFCYWKDRDQPVVYIDGLPESLSRVLYRELIGPLEYGQNLRLREGVPRRNVNPYLFDVTRKRHTRTHCPQGHPYEGNEMPSDRTGWRCRICYLAYREAYRQAHLVGTPSVSDINRSKDSCPRDHPYEGDNLIILPNGRRRCRQCHADNARRYRAEKGKNRDPRHNRAARL